MGRGRKHHRKIKQFHLESKPTNSKRSIHEVSATLLKDEGSLIKKDLLTTLIIIFTLVVVLVISSTINSKTYWTIELGTKLYQILHIR